MGQFTKTLESQPKSIQNLIRHLVKLTHPDQVILFGSRARGNHRETSDFDIAIKAEALSKKNWNQALLEINEKPLTLFSLDLLHYEGLDETYRKNIDQEGLLLYG